MTTDETGRPGRISPEDVLQLLREQDTLHRRLATYAERQRMLVSAEDVGALLELLSDRQKLTDDLSIIGRKLAPVREDWPAYRRRLSAAQTSEAETLIQGARAQLESVMRSDAEDARILSSRKQAVARELRASHSTGQALSAYQSSVDRPVRLDCMDEVEA